MNIAWNWCGGCELRCSSFIIPPDNSGYQLYLQTLKVHQRLTGRSSVLEHWLVPLIRLGMDLSHEARCLMYFQLFSLSVINLLKPTATVQFYWKNVTFVNTPNSGWRFPLRGSLEDIALIYLEEKGITFECLPVQIRVGNKVKLQRSPGKLIFPNYISWQETQILEVPVEIMQYLNSD